jgi:uncharacterized membrane protein YjjP (DUF1212 family)
MPSRRLLPWLLVLGAAAFASALFDWSAGPAIVIALAASALLAGRALRVAAAGRQR